MHVCVCEWVCVHARARVSCLCVVVGGRACTRVHARARVCTYTRGRGLVCVHTRARTCMRVHTRACACVGVCGRACTHVHMCAHTFVSVDERAHVGIQMCGCGFGSGLVLEWGGRGVSFVRSVLVAWADMYRRRCGYGWA